jgi:hypothetical protein
MRRWLEHYETLLRAVAADPAQPVAELPLTAPVPALAETTRIQQLTTL